MLKLILLLAAAARADDAAIIEGRKFAILLASNVPDQNPGKVALARDKNGVRGLVAAQPFAAGDVLLAVPLERCLVEGVLLLNAAELAERGGRREVGGTVAVVVLFEDNPPPQDVVVTRDGIDIEPRW